MIDAKYALKYSFPHSIVHIVDNSAVTGETVIENVPDPSLYSTIVVTGLPMGKDNQIVTINSSDVLNTGYGVNTLTTSDVVKYGQSVEYPMALLQQNVPVKLLRVTPDDATYGVGVIQIQWKTNTKEIEGSEGGVRKSLQVRFKVVTEDEFDEANIDLSEYKNIDRLNKAIVSRLSNANLNVAEDEWHKRVFLTAISAGRGSAYNRMKFYINKGEYPARATAVTYDFGTIDSLNGLTVERFVASLVNDSTSIQTMDVINSSTADRINTVNIEVSRRKDGSSVLVPTINESAVREVYNTYMEIFKFNKTSGDTEYADYGRAYDEIYNTLNINKFDIIYGMYRYKDSIFALPYYQVDMYNEDVPRLPEQQRIKVTAGTISSNPVYKAPSAVFDKVMASVITNIHDKTPENPAPGDVYLSGQNSTNPYFNMVTSINLKNGAVSTIPFYKVWPLAADNTVQKPDTEHPDVKSVGIDRIVNGISPLLMYSTSSADYSEAKTAFKNKLNRLGVT